MPEVPGGWTERGAAMKAKLQSLGLAGVLAYGILNTIYYTAAFYTIWVYVAKVPRGKEHKTPELNPKPCDERSAKQQVESKIQAVQHRGSVSVRRLE